MIPASPLFYPIPNRDSGVFVYTADTIIKGGLPYRDVWDHKLPLIYYINALGLIISDGSMWGVWILEFLSIFISAIICLKILGDSFGIIPAWTSLFLLIVQFSLFIEDSNFTEVYALCIQFFILFLMLRIIYSPKRSIYWFLFGIAGSVLFFLRQNLIGVWISGFCIVILNSIKYLKFFYRNLIILILGCISVVLSIFIYFSIYHSLNKLIDAAFIYNYYYLYTTTGIFPRIRTVLIGLSLTMYTGFGVFSIIGWITGIINYSRKFKLVNIIRDYLLLFALIDFPIEMILVCISGRIPPHYFIPWLPALAILSAYLVKSFIEVIEKYLSIIYKFSKPITLCLSLIIFFPLSIIALVRNPIPSTYAVNYYSQRQVISDYITNNTEESDYVLFWGSESSINFYTNRRSPTRFVYQNPLFTKGYQTSEMIDEFFNDIKQNRPKLIIDAWKGTDKVPPIDSTARNNWTSPWSHAYGMHPEMEKVTDYIEANYEITSKLGPQQWVVYTIITNNQ